MILITRPKEQSKDLKLLLDARGYKTFLESLYNIRYYKNKVTYNKDIGRPVKDCKEFSFEKKIYIDHMLEDNIGRITQIRTKTRQLKN